MSTESDHVNRIRNGISRRWWCNIKIERIYILHHLWRWRNWRRMWLHKCGKISDGECTCSDKICDNCGRAESDCNCCGPGCMYRGGMEENSGCTCFSIETLRMSRIYEDAVGAYTPPWGCLCCHTYVQSHLNHLPCCYNADEYGTNFWQNTLWRGSARYRERPRTKARKGFK